MQVQEPQEIIVSYLLDSSRHEDDIAQPGSISILKEHKLAQSIIYIVKYINLQQQQIYACMLIRQTKANTWEFANFLMMGGTPNIDLSQKPSPRIAWSRFSDARGSFTGFVVFPNEVQITALRLKDSHGFVATSQLENDAALFVTSQVLHKPLFIEMLDDENKLFSQKTLL